MTDAFIYDGIRTPFGRHAGGLAGMRADDLLAGTIRTLMARSPFDREAARGAHSPFDVAPWATPPT